MSKRTSFATLLDPHAAPEEPEAPAGPPTRARLADIAANPDNPRDPEDLDLSELIDSFREVGQLQPVVVVSRAVYLAHAPQHAATLGPAAWVVLGGNRRLEAARALDWEHLDIVVRDQLGQGDDGDTFLDEAVIIENIHRKALAPMREAGFLQQMVDRYGSQGKVAKRIGKTQAYVSQRLALLRLAPELRQAVDSGALKVKEARKLASLPTGEEQVQAWREPQEATPRPAGTHNPVMGTGVGGTADKAPGGSETHNPVMGAADRPARPVPTARPEPAPSESAPERVVPNPADVRVVPWDDPRAVARIAAERMTPDGVAQLVKLLGEHTGR